MIKMQYDVTLWKRNAALFMIGQGVTLFGSTLVHYAIVWHITLQTRSGLMMTLLAVVAILPMFFISPFAGVWADRYNKKFIINITDAAIAVVTLIIAVIFALDLKLLWLLFICLIARGFGQGIQMPSFNAIIPEIVPSEHLVRINGINGGVQSFVMVASPMAGAAILVIAPIHILMLIDVATAIIGISILAFFVKTPLKSKNKDIPPGARQYILEIREGINYIVKRSFLKKMLISGAILNIMLAPLAMMTPLHVARRYGDDVWLLFSRFTFGAEQRLATIEISFFTGMILGGLFMGLWIGFKNKSHTKALATYLIGISSISLGIVGNFWLFMLCIGIGGFIMNISGPVSMAILQTNIESEYMGRVLSVFYMNSSLMMPLGMIFWGPLGDIIDIEWIFIGTGLASFMIGFLWSFDKDLLKAGVTDGKAG